MVTVLESHLSLLEHEAEDAPESTLSERVEHMRDLISMHLAVYEGMERHLGENGIAEAHRPLVPLFQRWLNTARRISDAARELRIQGHPVPGIDELIRTINRSKPMAEDFEDYVRLNQRIMSGEAGTYRPLDEVLDELRHLDQS
jgi:hypothetical protein